MAIVRTRSVALIGLTGTMVEIEVDLSSNLPGMVVIGLPDTALSESRERVRAACANSLLPLPQRRLTVNLSPAALPKHGSGFDLGMAVAALATAGGFDETSIEGTVHLGELGLDGRVRPIAGILPAVLAARRAGHRRVMVPEANRAEAELVPDVEVLAVGSLREAALAHGAFRDRPEVEAAIRDEATDARAASSAQATGSAAPAAPEAELADVVGNPDAVDALVVAAAGGHHLMMIGPPGAGKTMLASRLPALLPDLDDEEALEATCLRSIRGETGLAALVRRPPFEQPHHTASAAAIVGGGSGRIRPGAAAMASHGVLFLDEAPEFSASALDALRQPLESGTITLHRALTTATFPARFQLVLAANPCPCGRYGTELECSCPPTVRRRYLARISGPLRDRIDLHIAVGRITPAQLRLAEPGQSTAEARGRVVAARRRARRRLRATPWRNMAEVAGSWLRQENPLPRAVLAPLDRALEVGAITMRGFDRILRCAWTLADLAERDEPGAAEIGRALYLRGTTG